MPPLAHVDGQIDLLQSYDLFETNVALSEPPIFEPVAHATEKMSPLINIDGQIDHLQSYDLFHTDVVLLKPLPAAAAIVSKKMPPFACFDEQINLLQSCGHLFDDNAALLKPPVILEATCGEKIMPPLGHINERINLLQTYQILDTNMALKPPVFEATTTMGMIAPLVHMEGQIGLLQSSVYHLIDGDAALMLKTPILEAEEMVATLAHITSQIDLPQSSDTFEATAALLSKLPVFKAMEKMPPLAHSDTQSNILQSSDIFDANAALLSKPPVLEAAEKMAPLALINTQIEVLQSSDIFEANAALSSKPPIFEATEKKPPLAHINNGQIDLLQSSNSFKANAALLLKPPVFEAAEKMPPLSHIGAQIDLFQSTSDILDANAVLTSSKPPIVAWSPKDSESLYCMQGWGEGYFSINSLGHISVRPHGLSTPLPQGEIDLLAVVQKAIARGGMQSPLIVRFPAILEDRLALLQSSFDEAIARHDYRGQYQGVYPVKCNQDRYVVEKVVEFSRGGTRFGLEAGSKPELLLAIASLIQGGGTTSSSKREGFLVCNGYKDEEYIGMALRARVLGLNCMIVLEEEEELERVLKVSRRVGVQPVLGLRARLSTRHAGHFGATSGEGGKFGLTAAGIVGVVQRLCHAGMLHCLQLLHFHVGSQIPCLPVLREAAAEAVQIYCELVHMGAPMGTLDIGGGLGIDYNGTKSASSDQSVAYTLAEFADEVVSTVASVCRGRNIPEPKTLCSESGRALVSHHSVLVFDVLSATMATPPPPIALHVADLPADVAELYSKLADSTTSANNRATSAEYAKQLKRISSSLFKAGKLSLPQLAHVSTLCDSVDSHKASVYHANVSVFQSMPDTWAIGQLFPMVPLQRLDERPTVDATLADLTCDSDGKVGTFIAATGDGGAQRGGLPVHSLVEGSPYYVAMFLGGAYQEALGSLHNLFGTPDVVHVTGGQDFELGPVISGQRSLEVLASMHYNPLHMLSHIHMHILHSQHHPNQNEKDHFSRYTNNKVAMAAQAFKSFALAFASKPYLHPYNTTPTVLY